MTTRAACLIGWPAAHSRSPVIHKYWLKSFGIDGDYRIEAVKPEDFAAFVARLGERGYLGANVTLPHKEQALRVADADARARAVGAANTLWFENGALRATNTDVEGFVGSLDASVPGWDKAGEALVLGAGGAARAVVFGLIERGFKTIHLVNRTLPRAETLARQFGASVKPAEWDRIATLLPRAALLVNTTSLGMKGQPPLEIDLQLLPAGATVSDAVVYSSLQTSLLQAAAARGLRTADGLGMLLHQAVRGFSLWFGRQPTVTAELRALVEADLTRA
jgi:shikimate dehydrogenase